jgi:hypothetical protein
MREPILLGYFAGLKDYTDVSVNLVAVEGVGNVVKKG